MTNKIFTDTVEFADSVKKGYAQRDANAKMYRDMYMLNWGKEDVAKKALPHAKISIHPLPRKAAQGAKRLMTATSAGFSVPSEYSQLSSDYREKMTRIANAIWWQSSKYNGIDLEEDAVLSMIIQDEIHIQISSTADMLNSHNNKDDPYYLEMKEIAESTPYLVEVRDPASGYPVWGRHGLRAYYWEESVTVEDLISRYGDKWKQTISPDLGANRSRFSNLTVCHMWDKIYRHTWLRGGTDPLVQLEHGLPIIPFVCTLGEGSRSLFSDPEDQRQPFLYTLDKTKVWDWLNVILSNWRTNQALTLGVQFIHEGDGEVKIDFGEIFGSIEVPAGERFQLLADKGVLSESDMVFYREAEQLGTESTIYNQALGEPLGKGEAYSKVALLHQAGRLPLVTIQRQTAKAMGEAMEKVFKWMRHDGESYKARLDNGEFVEIEAKKIPAYPVIKARLEIDLPQDQLSNANIFKQLEGSLSEEWRMENILSIENPKEERRRALKEEIKKQLGKIMIQDILMQMQVKNQQRLAGTQMGPPPNMPEGQRPPPGPTSGMSPEEARALALADKYGGTPPAPVAPPIPNQNEPQRIVPQSPVKGTQWGGEG